MSGTLPDKWQVVRNTGGPKPPKKTANGGDKALFKPVPLAANTYENLEDENHSLSEDDLRYGLISNGKGTKKTATSKSSRKSKKGPPSPPVAPPDPIVIDFAKLAGSAALCRDKFPENDLLLLQEIANFIRMDADFTGAIKLASSTDDFSFPLKHLTPRQMAELRTVVGSVQDEVAYCRFIEYAIDELTTAFSRGENLWSHRLCLQLISLERPDVFVRLADKFAGIVKNSKNVPHRLSAIMSAFSQAGHGSLSAGLNVWFTVMLPTIQLPNMTNSVLTYGEKLLQAYNILNDFQLPPSSAPQTLRPAFDLLMNSLQSCQPYNPPPISELFAREVVVSPQNFFRLFDMVHPINATTGKLTQPLYLTRMTPSQKRQLASLCFKVKVLLMKYGSDCCPSTMFPSFLVRYNKNLPYVVRKEMLVNLLVCIHCDQSGCSQAWLGTCSRYPENAGLLHTSVDESMPFFADFVPDLSQLRKTLRKVQQAIVATGVDGVVAPCAADGPGICRRFMGAMWRLIKTVAFLLMLAIVADLLLANCDPQAMTTTKLLKEYKIYKPMMKQYDKALVQWKALVKACYPYCKQVYIGIAPYAVWITEKSIDYLRPVQRAATPYVQAAWKHAGHFYVYAGEQAHKANIWLVDNGVDIKGSVSWLVKSGLPLLAKWAYDGSVAVSKFAETNVVPTVRYSIDWMSTTMVPWLQQQWNWAVASIRSTAASYGYNI